jgi:hypothetical protein
MRTKTVLVGIAIAVIAHSSYAQDAQLGVCDANADRDQESAQFIVNSRADTDSEFAAKRPCTNEPVHIKKCAVISVESDSFQLFCHGTGRPTYYEDVEVVHYWAAHNANAPAK